MSMEIRKRIKKFYLFLAAALLATGCAGHGPAEGALDGQQSQAGQQSVEDRTEFINKNALGPTAMEQVYQAIEEYKRYVADTDAGDLSGDRQAGGTDVEDPWRLQEEALKERMDYYVKSAYYPDIINYWENVRGVTDVSNRIEYLYETDTRYYTAEDFEKEPDYVIHLAKNEIYARHGYIFNDPDLYNYFMGCIWYMPTTAPKDFEESVLNEYERENVKVLAGCDTYVAPAQ